MANMSSSLISQTVTPFLREHIPSNYAPISKVDNDDTSMSKDPNSKFCYRHRPDSKCRKAADESKMGMIQRELDQLSAADRQAITHVWSLFSAAPSRHRVLMLKGVLQTACFPQLSVVSREIGEQLKIDFITALPVEISQKILCYLDTVSLCKAAQVSQRWRQLADDDQVWLHMCEQHVNKKCTACGWGLPLLERRKLRDWKRQRRLQKDSQEQRAIEELTCPPVIHAPNTPRSPSPPANKRDASHLDGGVLVKRQRVNRATSENSTWKNIYRDRFKVGSNWKYGRARLNVLQGHTNGVTCLQMDDNMLASGSYDATVRIWDLQTGKELRVLRGHQAGIRCLQFDDSKLVSGSLDGVIKIWNYHTGECLTTLRGHSNGVISVHFDGELLASGSIDKSIKVFNFQTKVSYCLRAHDDWVNCVRLDTESRTLLSSSDDCTVKLWDLDSKTVIRTFVGHVGHVQQVLPMPLDFEPDEDVISGCSAADNTDSVSECSSHSETPVPHRASSVLGSQEEDIRSHYGPGFTSDPSRPLPPRYLLTGGLDSTIRLFDSATGKCLKTFFGHLEGIWGLAGDSLRVVTGANDACVKLWEPRSGKCERTVTGHRGPVTCVGLSDSRMASGGEDNEVRVYSFGSSPGPGPTIEVGTPN
ncbi:WD40 repeat-like protein [Coniochaeta ligniaria NRRL 30616]|uniref:WD40 repeat-like protein n=1 Tax=Coniochaeta ligniaria NRRL 30616 TaxID=1408157 RepID=A0A1J7IYV0_9PEZI|nr:WD40 repeat-like protein [Coniochaeta ligniaria NRRL 30616]